MVTAGSPSTVSNPGGRASSALAWWAFAGSAGLGIVALGSMGLYFSPPGSAVALWWPAGGVAAALAVLTPKRRAWLAAAVVLAATFVANVLGGHSVGLSIWYGVGNALEACVAAVILTSGYKKSAVLESLPEILRLLGATAAAAGTVGVIGAAGVTIVRGGGYLEAAQSIAASHMAALVVILPVAITARGRALRRSLLVEAILQFCLLLAVAVATYTDPNGLPTTFLALPVLIWGALRLTTRLVAVEVLVLGTVMVFGTHLGRGPFGLALDQISMANARLLLQAAILVHALVAVPVVVVANQLRTTLRNARLARDELASVLDSPHSLAIMADDLEGNIKIWSVGSEAMFGYTREEAVGGLRGRDLYAIDPSSPNNFQEVVAPLFEGAPVVDADFSLRRKDGTEFIGNVSLSLRRSGSTGEWFGYLAVVEDVSQGRKTEEALRTALRHEHEAVERLAELDRSKNHFISSVSHELRTPITSVLGYTDLMRDFDLPPEQRRLLDPVVRNARRLEVLIEDLLTLSRMDSGSFVYRPAPLDLRETIRSAVEAVLESSADRKVEVIVNFGDSEIAMSGDATQLQRAVSNLVNNAVKFTPDGGRVTVDVVRDEAYVVLTVTDSGIGIPLSEQGKVFDRFFRSSTSEFLAIDGTGVGLHIVNQVVTAHGGRVTFTSAENEGSTFTVRLPIRSE